LRGGDTKGARATARTGSSSSSAINSWTERLLDRLAIHIEPDIATPTDTRLIQAIHAAPENANMAKAMANEAASPEARIHRVDTNSCMEAPPEKKTLLW